MKKYRFEFIIFMVNIIYMVLELIASRILSPYFGNSTMIWTSVIGIILLSSSIGNYIGGIIADKEKLQKAVRIILILSGITTLLIPLIQSDVLSLVLKFVDDIKIGAILSTILLFFIPSMLTGFLSPIITKIKMEDLKTAGKTAGRISAIATLGCIVGDFVGGFYLIPKFGSNAILYVLAISLFILTFFVDGINLKQKPDKIFVSSIILCIISGLLFVSYSYYNEECSEKVLAGENLIYATYDTEYGRALIYNVETENGQVRELNIDRGNESASYTSEDKCYELVYDYTKLYDLMFESKNEIKDTLMIGGAGFSYPKYYISHYSEKNMDVIEFDGKIIELAKQYFFLDKLIKEFDLENNNRLNIIEEDGRAYLNKNEKKYDAILNDAFAGESPAETLTTVETAKRIYASLNEDGLYLTNIISSLDGEDAKFLKSEVKTLKEVFKNVYIVPCISKYNVNLRQNLMVIATDQEIEFERAVTINIGEDDIILTDDYNPIDMLTGAI